MERANDSTLSNDTASLVNAFKVEAGNNGKANTPTQPTKEVPKEGTKKAEVPTESKEDKPEFVDPFTTLEPKTTADPVTEEKAPPKEGDEKPELSNDAEGLKDALKTEGETRNKKSPEQKGAEKEGSMSWLKAKWSEEQEKSTAQAKRIAELEEKEKSLAELDTLKEKVSKLETYEALYEVDNDPTIQNNITIPLQKVTQSLVHFGEEYGLTESQLNSLLDIDDEVKRLRTISTLFKNDVVVANKVDSLVKDFVRLNGEMAEARSKPIEKIQELRSQRQNNEVLDNKQISEHVDNIASASFDLVSNGYKSLPQTRLYFNKVAGDDKQNQIVEQLDTHARQIYAKVIGDMKNSGIRKFDSSTSTAIAALALKASRFDTLVTNFMEAQEDNRQLQATISEYRGINRPKMNTSSHGGASEMTNDERLAATLEKYKDK